MTTVTQLRRELADECSEYIVSLDQNVDEEFDHETSFHAIVHPNMDDESQPQVPDQIVDFVETNSKKHTISWCGLHFHISMACKDEQQTSDYTATELEEPPQS